MLDNADNCLLVLFVTHLGLDNSRAAGTTKDCWLKHIIHLIQSLEVVAAATGLKLRYLRQD
jgi:hypothetical protein